MEKPIDDEERSKNKRKVDEVEEDKMTEKKKGKFYSRNKDMCNSQKMHESNLYKHYKPDFSLLSDLYPESFGKYATKNDKGKVKIDWKDPEAVRQVTKTLLKHDFGIEWELPLDYMCPPVPNRLNYICWVADLVKSLRKLRPPDDPEAPVRGIDIGTGASCIYPLLGHATSKGTWRFLATEIDTEAAEYAQKNIDQNALSDIIKIRIPTLPDDSFDGERPGPLLSAVQPEDGCFDFSMCNPPFFSNEKEANQNPRTCCQGRSKEVVTPGGEYGFISLMIKDSWRLRRRIGWYTTMVGKKGTLRQLLALLRKPPDSDDSQNHQPLTVRTTEFLQGYTSRWALAWSFVPEMQESQDPSASQKVFGKKKEQRRRKDFSFLVPRTPLPGTVDREGQKLCIEDIVSRFRTFIDSYKGASVSLVNVSGNSEKQKLRGMLQTHSSPVGTLQLGQIHFTAVISEESYKEFNFFMNIDDDSQNQDPANKARSLFWKMVDLIPGEINRSNRKWRRIVAKGKTHTVSEVKIDSSK